MTQNSANWLHDCDPAFNPEAAVLLSRELNPLWRRPEVAAKLKEYADRLVPGARIICNQKQHAAKAKLINLLAPGSPASVASLAFKVTSLSAGNPICSPPSSCREKIPTFPPKSWASRCFAAVWQGNKRRRGFEAPRVRFCANYSHQASQRSAKMQSCEREEGSGRSEEHENVMRRNTHHLAHYWCFALFWLRFALTKSFGCQASNATRPVSDTCR